MGEVEDLGALAPDQCVIRIAKAANTQALNTRLFYELIRLKRVSATSKFADLISNYDLVVHKVLSIYLHRSNVPKEHIKFTLTTLQDVEHSFWTAFRDSE